MIAKEIIGFGNYGCDVQQRSRIDCKPLQCTLLDTSTKIHNDVRTFPCDTILVTFIVWMTIQIVKQGTLTRHEEG